MRHSVSHRDFSGIARFVPWKIVPRPRILHSQGGNEMDQVKIGEFLKTLRKEKGLTQEQLAEQFHVNRRTVSRWETGSNLPDLDILVEMSDYYDVDLRELIDGERKSETMDKETKETVLKAADYTSEQAEKSNKLVRMFSAAALVLLMAFVIIRAVPQYGDNAVLTACADFAQGFGFGMLIAGLLISIGIAAKTRAFQKRIREKTGK